MKKFKTKGELKALAAADFSSNPGATDPESQGNKHMKTSSDSSLSKMVEVKSGHVCVVCKKKFKTPSQLSYHEMYHTADEYKQVREEAAVENKQQRRESISNSEDEKEKPPAKPKTARKQLKPEKRSPVRAPSPIQNNTPQSGKKKISCDKCKKKFSDSMTLEYHKITFHAVAMAVKPPAKSKANNSTPSKPKGRVAKSREFVDDSSDSETEESKVPESPAKRKQESPKSLTKKMKRDPSSSEDERVKPTKKEEPKPVKRLVSKKIDIREVKSKESQRSRALANSKRAPTPPLSSSEEDSASDNDYDDIKLRQTKPASKSAKPAASRNPISPASSSASRPNHKKINGGGRINTDTKTYNSLLADELDVRQDFISTKNEKVPCNQCGRLMGNSAVLAYHEIRCTGSATAKRKLSQDSGRTLSTDSRASASFDFSDKKVRKPPPAASKKPPPPAPTKVLVKPVKNAYSSDSHEEDLYDEEAEVEKEELVFIPQKSSKTEKKEIYTSDEEEKEEVKVEEKKETVPEKPIPKEKDDFQSKFSSKGFTEIPPANLYREKLLFAKSSKVKCEFCGKSFKNEQVLGHHNIYCNTPKVDKSKPKPSPAKLKLVTPDPKPDFVERTIINSRASQSPVDLILKKLTGGVNNHSNSTGEEATNSESESAGSTTAAESRVGGESSKEKFDRSEDEDSDSEEDNVKEQQKESDNQEGDSDKHEDSGGENDRRADNGREKDRLADTKVSIYTSSEEENGDQTSDSGPKRPVMHPNARHGVEILEEDMRRKKRAKKEKKAKKKAARKKAKKAKKKRSSSSDDDDESDSDEDASPPSKKKRPAKSAREAQPPPPPPKIDSDSSISSHHESPPKSVPRRKALAKPKKNPNYCFCDKPENNDMIGCDYCDMWYHPECLGLDEEQTLKLTESSSWMCPECVDSSARKSAAGKGRRNGAVTSRRKTRSDSDSDSD